MILAGGISVFVGYKFQPMVADNPNAVNTVVTIFSILAGFLVATIALIVEPSLQQAKTWSELQILKRTIKRKIFRQKILFFLYLTTLGLALSMFLAPDSLVKIQYYLQFSFLCLATFVFICSFTLPGSLMKIQMERYDAALEVKKPKVIKDATTE